MTSDKDALVALLRESVKRFRCTCNPHDDLAYSCASCKLEAKVDAAVTAALAEKDDGWVKCSERLPKKSDADERGHVWGYVNGTAGLHDWEWFHTPYAIKHNCMWRPLPPLPKGDE